MLNLQVLIFIIYFEMSFYVRRKTLFIYFFKKKLNTTLGFQKLKHWRQLLKIQFSIHKWKGRSKYQMLNIKYNLNAKTKHVLFPSLVILEIATYMTKLYEEVFRVKRVWLSLTIDYISTEFIIELFKQHY